MMDIKQEKKLKSEKIRRVITLSYALGARGRRKEQAFFLRFLSIFRLKRHENIGF